MQAGGQTPVSESDDDRTDFLYTFEGPVDPRDLSNLPEDFKTNPYFQERKYLDDPEELAYIRNVAASFFNYKHDAFQDLTKMQKDYCSLPESSKELIRDFMEERFDRLRDAIDANYSFLGQTAGEYAPMFRWRTLPSGDYFLPPFGIQYKDISKLRSTLRQIAREWSSEGRIERATTFQPCIDLITAEFPDNETRPEKKILCPGAGLGRLPFELVSKGFTTQANEFSYHMLIVSNYILNEIQGKETCRIFPNIHNLNNKQNAAEIFKEVRFPDICLADTIDPRADFSMVAGEFVEVYSKQPNRWDAVVTCFFIDTAHNIVEYLQAIYKMLKPGGVWVSLGPLLYHYAEMPNELSIELTWEEVKAVATKIGFTFEVLEVHQVEETVRGSYCSSGQSMMETLYNSKLIKARK